MPVRRQSWLTITSLCLATGLAFLSGCSRGESAAGTGPVIKLGVIAPFNTPPGEGIRNGVKMAVAEINAAGGISGRRLEVVEIDEEYSAEKAVRGYQRLAGRDQVVAVIGVASDGIFPIMEQLARYKVPVLTTGAGSDKLTELVAAEPARYKWFFRVMHKSSELGNATADFALNNLHKNYGINRFAIMVEDDIWTKYIKDIWTKELTRSTGTSVVFSDTFSSQTEDFSVLFQKVLGSGAEYILDASSKVDASQYLKRWATVGAPPIGAIPTGAGTKRYYDLLGEKGLYVCSVATIPSASNPLTSRSASWAGSYQQKFGDAEFTSAYSYDAVFILADALKAAQGKTDADSVVAVLERTDHAGVVARWVFGPDHHSRYGEGFREIPIVQYLEPRPDGFKVVWPAHRAAAKYVLPTKTQQ